MVLLRYIYFKLAINTRHPQGTRQWPRRRQEDAFHRREDVPKPLEVCVPPEDGLVEEVGEEEDRVVDEEWSEVFTLVKRLVAYEGAVEGWCSVVT